MMDQCILLGVCLGWAATLCLYARAWDAAAAGGLLLANWLIWSFAILLLADWEPWMIAMALDGATAFLMWRVCGDAVLAATSAHLVLLHAVRACGWIGYDAYYDYGLTVGFMQAGWVGLIGVLTMRKRRAVTA